MAKEPKSAALNLRVRPSIKALAQARADALDRSLASYIEQLVLRDAATDQDGKPKSGER
jgi:predicted HicB family RNase H-like nuclease